jgi:hypothetical protein
LPASPTSAPTLVTLASRRGRKPGQSRVAITCRPSADASSICPNRLPGHPSRARLTWRGAGGDMDFGFTGEAHNFAFLDGGGLDLCLRACDGSTTTACQVRAARAARPFAPLPLLSNGVPVCLDTRFVAPPTGTFDLASGALALDVAVAADVFVLQPSGSVCPRCAGDGTVGSTGLCLSGENQGAPCVVEALTTVVGGTGEFVYQLSGDCPPAGSAASTLDLAFTLSTGERRLDGRRPCPKQTIDDSCEGAGICTRECSGTPAPKGGVNQTCCSNNPQRPCYPTAPGTAGAIVRTGTPAALLPAPPDLAYPKTGDGVLAHVGCLLSTTDATVDGLNGLPGPTTWLLPFRAVVTDD